MRDQGKVPPRHRAIAGDDVSDPVLEALVKDSLALAFAHAAEGAGAYVFHADVKRLLFEGAMARAGFLVHQTLVWVKQRITLGHMDYLSQHEPVLYGWKQGGKHGWYGGRRRSALVADEAPDLEAHDWRRGARAPARPLRARPRSSATIGRPSPRSIPP